MLKSECENVKTDNIHIYTTTYIKYIMVTSSDKWFKWQEIQVLVYFGAEYSVALAVEKYTAGRTEMRNFIR